MTEERRSLLEALQARAGASARARRRAGAEALDALPAGLPPALRPWSATFAGMPEAHLIALGGLMAALAPLLDRPETALRQGVAEIDAFDDVAAEGPLERLMMTELMWLQLAPTEFARRVAEGEALRRRPNRRDRTEDRAVAALIDCGPAMFGRRRLVALAGLLCLASSSSRRGVRFVWSTSGLDGAPIWVEGLDRRSLSRFVRQTAMTGLDDAFAAARLADAPIDADREKRVVWTIGSGQASGAPGVALDAADFRLEISEAAGVTAPAMSAAADAGRRVASGAAGGVGAEVAVVARSGARRVARIAYPAEAVCAETLRAPFRAKAEPIAPGESTGWAPTAMAIDPEGAVYVRDGGGVAVIAGGAHRFWLELGDDATLLGVRWVNAAHGAVALRRGDTLIAVRNRLDGKGVTRASCALASDDSLRGDDHGPGAMPPLLRLGKRRDLAFGASDGRLFRLGLSEDGGEGALTYALSTYAGVFRLLGGRDQWLFGVAGDKDRRRLQLLHRKNGRRMSLACAEEDVLERSVRDVSPIGATGGAVLCDGARWRWLPNATAWPKDAPPPPPPPAAPSALLLEVHPGEHGAAPEWRLKERGMDVRRWSMSIWTPSVGFETLRFDGEAWSRTEMQSPLSATDQVRAVGRSGELIYALTTTPSGDDRLRSFRVGREASEVSWTRMQWRETFQCVAL